MADQQAIAEFLRSAVPFTQPLPSPAWYTVRAPIQWLPLPTSQDLAQLWLDSAEFRALQLGTWLNTTDGQVLVAAVELVLAPGYEQEFELLVDALQLAAEAQHQQGRRKAGFALAAVSAGLLAVTQIGT